MTDTKAITRTITLESIALLERRHAELAQTHPDRMTVRTNELLLYEFLISKLRAEADTSEQIANIMLRVDTMAIERNEDRELIEAVARDGSKTRYIALEAVELMKTTVARVDILAANVNAAMEELARVSKGAAAQAAQLEEEADVNRDRG